MTRHILAALAGVLPLVLVWAQRGSIASHRAKPPGGGRHTIEVTPDAKPGQYVVEVRNGGLVTEHWVTLDDNTQARLGDGVDPEQIITAAFRFLMDREPAGAILTEFDITTISSFFPEFEAELPNYLDDTV